jgi:uncharacterized membrane protein
MPRVVFTGHPLHPQMVVMPAALLPFSLMLDLLHVKTGDYSYADAAYYTMIGGFFGGIAAGMAGAADYRTIAGHSRAKRIGTVHGAMNVGLLALTGLNLFMRRKHRSPGIAPVLLSMIGNVGLFVSAWYGSHLVYHHGIGVRRSESSSPPDETKLPGDERMTHILASTIGETSLPQS